MRPDVIISRSTAATAALLYETRTRPVVFLLISDPVGDGLCRQHGSPCWSCYWLYRHSSFHGRKMVGVAQGDGAAHQPRCSNVRADRGDRRTRDDRPDAGHRHQPVACRSPQASAPSSLDRNSMRSSSRCQSSASPSMRCSMRGDRTSVRLASTPGNSMRRKRSLAHRNAALQQEGANLIDDAGALADQPLAHAVNGLQVELIAGLGGDEPHRRTLHRFGDRLRIAEVILLSFAVRTDVFRRH